MRDSSFISMTGLGRQRAISQSEFREMTPAGTSLPQPLSSVEDLQPIMRLIFFLLIFLVFFFGCVLWCGV